MEESKEIKLHTLDEAQVGRISDEELAKLRSTNTTETTKNEDPLEAQLRASHEIVEE